MARTEQNLHTQQIISDWLTKISPDRAYQCMTNYFHGTCWSAGSVCAVCSRFQYQNSTSKLTVPDNLADLNMDLLRISDPFTILHCIVQRQSPEFLFNNSSLDGLMLSRDGLLITDQGQVMINICAVCQSSLRNQRIPRLALANNLYRGQLPTEFADLTWVEEMACAIYRSTAHVTRLFHSSDPSTPRVLYRNTCAHNMNVVSTASVLPRIPSDLNDALSIVFIGDEKFDPRRIYAMFRVRKSKICNFLRFLKLHNKIYESIDIDLTLLRYFPDDDILPGLSERVIVHHTDTANQIFSYETAGFSEHPAQHFANTAFSGDYIERMGVADPEGHNISGREFVSAALRNLVPKFDKHHEHELPDLVLHHGADAVPEYKNPALILGMYPTLFPFGIGGFEDTTHNNALSFESQASYYFDIPDKAFRYHHLYIFVVLNIIQRRKAHLHTSFTVRKQGFESIAQELVGLSSAVLQSTASHLERERPMNELNDEQRKALKLLTSVNTISAKIPGSQAFKIFVRSEIRAYMAYFGLPTLYFTANPNPLHSPIFQLMCGDKSVDLSKRFPVLVPSHERDARLGKEASPIQYTLYSRCIRDWPGLACCFWTKHTVFAVYSGWARLGLLLSDKCRVQPLGLLVLP